jgi:hypothetical protein
MLNGALAMYRKDHVGLPSSAGLPTLIGQKIVHRLAIALERAPSTPSKAITIVRFRFL